MLTVLLSFAVILLSVLGLSVAALAGKRPIQSCCRNLEELPPNARACPLCGKHLER